MAYLYLAKQIGIAGVLGLWAFIVAKGLFANTQLRLSLAEEVALLTPAGLGVAIGLLFGLGIAGALTGPGILTGAGLFLALACWRLRGRIVSGLSGAANSIACHNTLVRLVMVAVAGTVVVPVALDGLTPPHHSDEVRYHLPYALHFVEQGRIVPDLDLRFPFFTLNVNLLYAAAIIFGDDVTPHFVHLLLGCLAGLALYVLAAPACGRVTALGAVLLFFVTPNFRVFAATAYIDLALAAFVTSTIACLDRARGRPALVICAGLALGAALGSKYLALALAPILVGWAAYRTRAGPQIARFTAVAALTGAPWYVYNLVWTGNPISPFAGEWFGTWPWTAEDLAAQMQQLAREGHERSLAGLLSLPYYLATDSWRFSIPPVPELLVLGLMALALLPWWSPSMRPYGILVLVVVVVWLFTSLYFRYATAILPVWCFISVWSVERILWFVVSLAARHQTIPAVARRRVSYTTAAIVLVFAEYHFWLHSRWLDPDAVAERVVHRDRFLRERIPVYGVAEHLRQSGARGEVILVFPPGPLLSYVRTSRIVGDHFGPMGFRQTFDRYSLCKERLVEELQPRGVSRLVLSQEFLQRWPGWSKYLTWRLTTEYADQHATVFRLESGEAPSHGDPQRDSGDLRRAHATFGDNDIRIIPYFPVASDGFPHGFVRIINHSDEAGSVVVRGVDDTGTRYGPTTLELKARQSRGFNSRGMLGCESARGEPGRMGDDAHGSWWLSLASELDIEASSYIRTEDGFVATMHEVARTAPGPAGRTVHHVPFFNAGNARSRASHLRLVNPGDRDVDISIVGRDDTGERASEEVRLSLPGGTACWLSASALESGASDGDGSGCDIISGHLGNGRGGWRLSVSATGGDIHVMSLLVDPTGRLSNLSASVGERSGEHTLPLFLPVSDSRDELQGLARIVNHSDEAGTVEIHGLDDTGALHGPVTLALDRQESVHLDSDDLETGNATKGLPMGLGDGEGYWRLRLATELVIEALAYVRSEDGFTVPMHEVARTTRSAEGETLHFVPFFNPGRNVRQVSRLRLSNSGGRDVEVAIEGRDSVGMEAPEGSVSLTLPAGRACMLSATTLESGKPEPGSGRCTDEEFDFEGRFGAGVGRWSIFVIAEGGDVQVMSLLRSPAGHLANMSTTNRMPTGRPAPGKELNHLPDMTIVQLGRWGPRSSRVGEPFNVQPNGNSALWFRFRKLDRHPNYKIYVGSQPAATFTNATRSIITASLTPKQSRRLLSTEGRVPIRLVDPKRGKQLLGHFHVRRR